MGLRHSRGDRGRRALVVLGALTLALAPAASLASICGNGVLESPEACDDGNLSGGDGCSAFCSLEECGNGVLDVGESCDPASGTCGGSPALACAGSPTCDDDCSAAMCGDGKVNPALPETCDTGGVDTPVCDGDPTGSPTAQNCTAAMCGDGRLNAANGELCDDGNGTSGDGCDLNCTPTGCGNGVVTPGEQCDDGNAVNDDGCDLNCTTTACGNGILNADEQCDDGNNVAGDGCGPGCLREECRNGVVQAGEECDPGAALPTATCDASCLAIDCGNGRVETTEVCDPGTGTGGPPLTQAVAGSPDCTVDCRSSSCGDLVVNPAAGESCDDGPGGACDDVSCLPVQCGDGVVQSNEACDPGTGAGADPFLALGDSAGCDRDCSTAACGDGFVNAAAGEQCDPIDNLEGGCGAACRALVCGDGVRVAPEACDDGNAIDGDGCDSNCTLSGCGNGIFNPGLGELCDDGNTQDGDGCDSNCSPTGCGNDIRTAGEECDDGNLVGADGCDGSCRDEVCGNGILGSSPNGNGASVPEQCDDGNLISSDGCLPSCVLDLDADGTLAPADACSPVAYSVPAASPPDQNPAQVRLTLGELDDVGDHDLVLRGRFNPARALVCEDDLTPCSLDTDCASVGAGSCGLPDPSRSGLHLRVTQGSPPLQAVLYEVSVPGHGDAPGSEYFRSSPTPACGSARDGWRVVQGGSGRAVYIYANRSGVIPADAPRDTTEGICTGDAKGISLVRLTFNPRQGEWRYVVRVRNTTLAAPPAVILGETQGPLQAQLALGAAGGYASSGLPGDAGQCADTQFRGEAAGGLGRVPACRSKRRGGALFRVSCR